MGDEHRYVGTVKRIIPAGDRPLHGFIDCPETRAQFNRDVFLHDKLASQVEVGQTISFSLAGNSQGMPQAVEVFLEDGTPLSTGAPGQAWGAAPSGHRIYELIAAEVSPAVQSGMGGAVAAALIAAAELLGVAHELSKQVSARMPQAKVAPVAAAAQYGSPWAAGDGWSPAKGSGKGGAWDSWTGGGYPAAANGAGKGYGKAGKAMTQRAAPYAASFMSANGGAQGAVEGMSGPYEGSVKRLCQDGAHVHGFIECAETRQIYGRDVFLHSAQAQELQAGDSVHFEVALNARGMPQAHNLIKF